jgi:hypothetical protein
MRATTPVWAQFESVGRPEHRLKICGTVREVTMRFAQWLLDVPMGSKIRVIIARDESELVDRRSAASEDMLNDLESIMAEQECEDGHS